MVPLCQYIALLLLAISCLASTLYSQEDQVSVQIVYMARSRETAASHVETLALVLGSEVAAKKAIIYEYTRILNGFAAKLTADQTNALLKHPEVLKILPGGIQKGDFYTP
ncbi:hypothetical protein Sjap_014470 [Stephania japonica]|uniref:Inhibitor I9 domain-containing protein n=1 Tax=Stephania japonica TaxID=461633 RepID=A0AAP0NQG0_9MAGN